MTEQEMEFRVEKDSIGTKDVPENVYYGVQSLRAAENFHITGLNMHPEIINSLAYIKKAAAITNCEAGLLDKRRTQAIVQACDEILEGKFFKSGCKPFHFTAFFKCKCKTRRKKGWFSYF